VRTSDFSDLLEEACRKAGVEPDSPSGGGGVRASIARRLASQANKLASHALDLMGRAASGAASGPAPFESYLEHESERAAPRAPLRKPVDAGAVAAELRISAAMSAADLADLRRAFARANHPDLAATNERDDATARMTIANMLIDRELQRRQPRVAAGRRQGKAGI
jgi:hypothetical protein